MKTWETEKQRADNALAESKAMLDAMPPEVAALARGFVEVIETVYEAWQEACAQRDEALEHLVKLANWGWGADAPDLAKIDWANARYFLLDDA